MEALGVVTKRRYPLPRLAIHHLFRHCYAYPVNKDYPSANSTITKMTSRRSFLKTSGLALGALSLNGIAQTTKPQKTVLLQCGWATKNIGDIGHTPGTLRFLEQYLPQAKVILWAVNTNEQVDAMLMKRFPKLEIVKGSLSQKDGAIQQA